MSDVSLVEYGYMLLEKAKNNGMNTEDLNEINEKFKKALEINPHNQAAWKGIDDVVQALVDYGYSIIESAKQPDISDIHRSDDVFGNTMRYAISKFNEALVLDKDNQMAKRGLIECSNTYIEISYRCYNNGVKRSYFEDALRLDSTNYLSWLGLYKAIQGGNAFGFYTVMEKVRYDEFHKDDRIDVSIVENSKARDCLYYALKYAPELEKPNIQRLIEEAQSEKTKGDAERRKTQILANSEYKNYNTHCYIATAIYGSYDAPETMVLRKFRDEHLLTNIPGRLFVKTYYILSPPFAKYLKHAKSLNKWVRKLLDIIIGRIN